MENEIMAVSAVAEAAEPVEITFAMDTKTVEDGLEEILKSMEALRYNQNRAIITGLW